MLKNNIYRGVLRSVRSLGRHRFFQSPLVARLLWDTAPRDALLLAACRSESFVVAANDPVIGQWLFKYREPFHFSRFERAAALLSDRGLTTLVDIGANIGTICIPAVTRGYVQQAIAIEPEPFNHALLRANIEVNRLADRIRSQAIALGERDDEVLTFELSRKNLANHRVRYGDGGVDGTDADAPESIQVPSQSLDRIMEGLDPATTLVWMDTQGFDGHVLAGAPRTLAQRPPLVIKFWPGGLTRSGGMPKLKAALQQAGYERVSDLNQPGEHPSALLDRHAGRAQRALRHGARADRPAAGLSRRLRPPSAP